MQVQPWALHHILHYNYNYNFNSCSWQVVVANCRVNYFEFTGQLPLTAQLNNGTGRGWPLVQLFMAAAWAFNGPPGLYSQQDATILPARTPPPVSDLCVVPRSGDLDMLAPGIGIQGCQTGAFERRLQRSCNRSFICTPLLVIWQQWGRSGTQISGVAKNLSHLVILVC